MRSTHADLIAAQISPSRVPIINAVVSNRWEATRRLDFEQLNSTTTTNAKHDIAVAGDDSITRVRVNGTNIDRNRVTAANVGTPANFDSWTTEVAGLASGNVACAAHTTRVAVVYNNGNNIYLYESTDYGATFGAATLIFAAAATVQDLAVAYKNSSGDLAIAVVTTTQLQINKRTGGAFGGAATHGTTQNSLNGVAMIYNGDYEMVVTGLQVTTVKPTVWSTGYGDGFEITLNTFGSWLVQFQANDSTICTYQAPSLLHQDGYRATFVDVPAYTGGATRTYFTYLHEDLPWVVGADAFRSPLPRDHHITNGLMWAKGSTHVYMTGHNGVWRAPIADVQLDVSADILELRLDEQPYDGAGYVVLDNTAAAYLGPPAPIQRGNLVRIDVGYPTASGDRTSRLQDFWVSGWRYERRGGVSTLRIDLEGGWRRLRRQRNRTAIDLGSVTYKVIVGAALSRAGFFVNVSGSSTRYNTITQRFMVDPTDTGETSIRRALAFCADRIRFREQCEANVVEPLASAAADYDLIAQEHPINAIAFGEPPPIANEAHGIGQTGTALIASPYTDYVEAEYGLGELLQIRDATATTGAAALATATALQRQRTLDERIGELRLQPIVGLELYDVLEFGDAAINVADQLARVAGISWRYERAREIWEQHITLCPR